MRLLSQNELTNILKINNTAIDQLVILGKIPYKRIISNSGDTIKFCPNDISKWVKKGINLLDDKKYIERLGKRLEQSNPEFLKQLKQFSLNYFEPVIPNRYYLEKITNKKIGFKYYVRYSENGRLIPTRWCTHTNDYDSAVRFAIDNRNRLIAEYRERQNDKKPYSELYPVLKKYYAKDSHYLEIDEKRGKKLGEKARINYHNFINQKFIPYLKKRGINSFEEIEVSILSKLQNILIADKKVKGKIIPGIKPQTLKHYISSIKRIFDNMILEGIVKVNPCKSLTSIKITEENSEERGCYETKLIKGVFNKSWENELSYLLCLLIYTTGMRNSEIEQMKVNDIIFINEYKFIEIKNSKTKSGKRTIPLHGFVYKKLMRYINKNKRKKDDFIFFETGKPLGGNRVYKEANLALAKFTGYTEKQLEEEYITFYSGRHFWKTLMNGEKLGIDAEEYFMGHKYSVEKFFNGRKFTNDIQDRYNHTHKHGQKNLLEKAEKVISILDKCVFR